MNTYTSQNQKVDSTDQFDLELNTVIANLEQAIEALKTHSLIDEVHIVQNHLSRLRSSSFRKRYRTVLKRRDLSPSAAVDRVIDDLAATILSCAEKPEYVSSR